MTDDERREVAAKLRELAQDSARCGDDGVGERACRVLLGPRVDLLDVVDAHFPLAHLADLIEPEPIDGDASDGYHTFNELYDHRAKLFSVVVAAFSNIAWKSKRHSDGSMYEGMFIVGIDTPDGQATYHYDIDPYWLMFDCRELPRAPKWDGHTPAQAIERIAGLADLIEPEERTCRVVTDIRDLSQTQDMHTKSCSACGYVFGSEQHCQLLPGIDKRVAIKSVVIPNYCPSCGAKVIQE